MDKQKPERPNESPKGTDLTDLSQAFFVHDDEPKRKQPPVVAYTFLGLGVTSIFLFLAFGDFSYLAFGGAASFIGGYFLLYERHFEKGKLESGLDEQAQALQATMNLLFEEAQEQKGQNVQNHSSLGGGDGGEVSETKAINS